jgi:D-glycero-D-manno-heptose 1,7-bisphosphate phosphatase
VKRAILLDRDGVLNYSELRLGKPYAPTRFQDFKIIPGTFEALSSLKEKGFSLAVVTNQPDVGNGKVKKEIVERMNAELLSKLPIDTVKVCYHSQTDGCKCRKPEPGMLIDAAEELKADIFTSYMIGDRWSDILAGKTAGCTTILINRHYNEQSADRPDFTAPSMMAAVTTILSQNMDV